MAAAGVAPGVEGEAAGAAAAAGCCTRCGKCALRSASSSSCALSTRNWKNSCTRGGEEAVTGRGVRGSGGGVSGAVDADEIMLRVPGGVEVDTGAGGRGSGGRHASRVSAGMTTDTEKTWADFPGCVMCVASGSKGGRRAGQGQIIC